MIDPIGESAPQAGVMATRPGDDAGGGADRGGVTVAQLLDQQPAEHGGAGGDGRVDPHQRGGPSAASSEPALKPNQPNHSMPAPIITSGTLCGSHGDLAEAEALADDQGEDQAGHTGVDVHDGATGEVDRRDVGGPVGRPEDQCRQAGLAAGQQTTTPHHVRDREVGQGDPEAGEHQPGGELHPVRDGAADQGDRDDGEGQLEADEDQLGDVAVAVVAEGVDQARGVLEAEFVEGIGDDAADVVRLPKDIE
jgi:hypothetical protein